MRAIRFACEFNFDIEFATFELMKNAAHKLASMNTDRVQIELKKVYERCEKPSRFFRLLDEMGGLKYHFEELVEAKKLLAGSVEFHPEGSVFNHLMNSFDTAKAKGFSYTVGIAALTHDFGKILSPLSEIEGKQKHIGHENKKEVLDAFFERHRFTEHDMTVSRMVFKKHMRWHQLLQMKSFKKVRFVRSIRKNLREEFVQACMCDAELTNEQLKCFNTICEAIDTAEISIPKEVLKKGSDVVEDFVTNLILKRYREIK